MPYFLRLALKLEILPRWFKELAGRPVPVKRCFSVGLRAEASELRRRAAEELSLEAEGAEEEDDELDVELRGAGTEDLPVLLYGLKSLRLFSQ